MLGVEPDYLLYFVSQRWTPVNNGVAMPPVIKRCLGGPGGAAAKLKIGVKFPCKSIVISSESGSFIRRMI